MGVLTLLWGVESDESLAAVHEALQNLGAPALLLDQRRAAETGFCMEDEATLTGRIRYDERYVELNEITGCYVRPDDTRRVPAIEQAGPTSPEWTHALEVDDALLGWLEITPAGPHARRRLIWKAPDGDHSVASAGRRVSRRG